MAKTPTVTSQLIAENDNWRLSCNTATTGFGAVTWVMKKKRPDNPKGKFEESAFIKAFADEDEMLEYAEAVGLKIKTIRIVRHPSGEAA